jgi:hypothetical protein
MLSDLRHEIESAEGLPDDEREGLREAVLEIETTLDARAKASEASEEPATSTGQRLADRALAVEAAHPALTEIIDRVMRQLSRMGI